MKVKRPRTRAPIRQLEACEQTKLFHWASVKSKEVHELALLFHIPNGGYRSKMEAGRLKLQGVKAGVPDIFLPVPRGPWHGLWIEMKRPDGKGRVSGHQQVWMVELSLQGYFVTICNSAEEAIDKISDYLSL